MLAVDAILKHYSENRKQKFLFVFDRLTRNTVLNRVIETFRFEDEI